MFFAHIFNTFLLPDALITTYKKIYANIPCSLYKRLHFLCTYFSRNSKFRILQHLLSATFCKKSLIVRVQTFAFLLKMWVWEGSFGQNLRKSYKLCGIDYMMFRLGSRTSARRETVGYAQMQN